MLAINGGNPVATNADWPKWPIWTPDTVRRLEQVLESRRWSISGFWTGQLPQEQVFAAKFAEYNRVPYCTPTANGTSAIRIALEALGVGAGDEVIVPGLTWVACASAVVSVNAVPVLVDIDAKTFCLDPAAVESAITDRTRAILVVHLYCSMADMDALRTISQRTGIPIVEDCAQSHGSQWRSEPAGGIGAVGIFSMHQGKPLTCGEGGAAITKDESVYVRMEQLRSDGRRFIRSPPLLGHMDLEETGEIQGHNQSLSDFHAALLLDGLERLDEQISVKQANARYLDEHLQGVPGLVAVARLPQVTRQSYYHYLIRFRPEQMAGRTSEDISRALDAELGFYVHPPYHPLSHHPLYRPLTKTSAAISPEHLRRLDPCQYNLPQSEAARRECVVFHHSVLLGTRRQMDAIVEAFAKVQTHAAEIPT